MAFIVENDVLRINYNLYVEQLSKNLQSSVLTGKDLGIVAEQRDIFFRAVFFDKLFAVFGVFRRTRDYFFGQASAGIAFISALPQTLLRATRSRAVTNPSRFVVTYVFS